MNDTAIVATTDGGTLETRATDDMFTPPIDPTTAALVQPPRVINPSRGDRRGGRDPSGPLQ